MVGEGRSRHTAEQNSDLPVVVIGGPQAVLRQALITQALEHAPGPRPWGLIRSPSLTARSDGFAQGAVTQIGACVCCTSPATLLAAYGRLHRAHGPLSGLIIELDSQAHVCALIDVLLSDSLRAVGLALCSVWHARPQWHLGSSDERTLQMIATADHLWLASSGQLPGLARYLSEQYWDEAILAEGQSPPAWRLPRNKAEGHALVIPPAEGDGAWMPVSCGDAGSWWRWRGQASQVLNRPRLQAVLADMARTARVKSARGVFRTEREWYGWQASGQWQPSFWRRDSRLDVFLQAGEPTQAWHQALNSCIA